MAVGLLLIFGGAIWLLLVIIWLPPLTILAVLVGVKIGLPNNLYGHWLPYVDVIMALCAMGYGLYLARPRRAISS